MGKEFAIKKKNPREARSVGKRGRETNFDKKEIKVDHSTLLLRTHADSRREEGEEGRGRRRRRGDALDAQ